MTQRKMTQRKNLTLELNLYREHLAILKRVAHTADVSLETIVTVMIAWGVERAIAEGTIKRRKS